MRFNKTRFAKLAGLPQSRGTLNESRRRKALRRRAMLKEGMYPGSREEMHNIDTFDPFDDDEIEMMPYDDYGRDSLRLDQMPHVDLEMDDFGPEQYERMSRYEMDDDDIYEGDHMEEGDMMYEADEMEEGMYEDEEVEEDMVEIDDRELVKEVRNIKRKRINEARLKAVIEDELREVLAEMQYGSNGSGWMYGDNKPATSKKGRITRGFKGLGFK
jgi:hypothetical protein